MQRKRFGARKTFLAFVFYFPLYKQSPEGSSRYLGNEQQDFKKL